jgi:outer membrane receptor protein involved in Fe transport
LRYNWFNASIEDKTIGSVEIKPSTMVVNAGLTYSLGSHHIYGSFNTGYRAPNIDDMGTLGIVDFRYEVPSFNLKPEKNYNTEIGYKIQTAQWKTSLALFYNRLNNLITRIKMDGQMIDGYNVYRKENVEEASIKGGEASVQWQLDRRWTARGAVTYLDGKNLTKNEPLRRIPPVNGNVSFTRYLNKLYLTTEFNWATKQNKLAQGDKEDNRIPLGGTPGWKVLNLFVGYQLKALHVRASGQNLFNEDYRTHGSGINGAGRSVLMSCTYLF